jgi:hypothetical protein
LWRDRHLDQAGAGADVITVRPRALLTLFALGFAACVDTNDTGPTTITWEAQLASLQYPDLSGHVAAFSDGDGTSVGVEITGAEAGTTLNWGIGIGSCAAPGQQIGPDSDYPALDPSLSGSASAEAQLAYSLSEEDTYYAELRSADGSQAACGDLEPTG